MSGRNPHRGGPRKPVFRVKHAIPAPSTAQAFGVLARRARSLLSLYAYGEAEQVVRPLFESIQADKAECVQKAKLAVFLLRHPFREAFTRELMGRMESIAVFLVNKEPKVSQQVFESLAVHHENPPFRLACLQFVERLLKGQAAAGQGRNWRTAYLKALQRVMRQSHGVDMAAYVYSEGHFFLAASLALATNSPRGLVGARNILVNKRAKLSAEEIVWLQRALRARQPR